MPNVDKPKAPLTPAQQKRKTEKQNLRRAKARAEKQAAKLRAERGKTLKGKVLNFIDSIVSK